MLDRDKDGQVSKVEYLSAMLVMLEKVDFSTIDLILEHFSILDLNGDGQLDRRDLEISQRFQALLRRIKLHIMPTYHLSSVRTKAPCPAVLCKTNSDVRDLGADCTPIAGLGFKAIWLMVWPGIKSTRAYRPVML